MERFLKNYSGPSKPKVTETLAKTESTKKRPFRKEWLNGREWLYHVEETNLMHCTFCVQHPNGLANKFIEGCGSFKIESIKFHEESTNHKWAAARHKADNTKPSEMPAGKMATSMTEAQKWRMCRLFRTAHAIGRHAMPFSRFQWMCRYIDIIGYLSFYTLNMNLEFNAFL